MTSGPSVLRKLLQATSQSRRTICMKGCSLPPDYLIKPLERRPARHIKRRILDIETIRIIRTTRILNINIDSAYPTTDLLARARKSCNSRRILRARRPLEVLEHHIANSQARRILQTKSKILLTIALIQLDCIIDILDVPSIVSNISYSPRTASAL